MENVGIIFEILSKLFGEYTICKDKLLQLIIEPPNGFIALTHLGVLEAVHPKSVDIMQ